jgi:hypothetical protein
VKSISRLLVFVDAEENEMKLNGSATEMIKANGPDGRR